MVYYSRTIYLAAIMVYYSRTAEVRQAFEPMVGKYEYLTTSLAPDARQAVQMANLQRGQRVLDLGTGGGSVIAAAKVAVQAGLCVAVDAVPGFLDVDARHHLAQRGLQVAPEGSSTKQVHLVRGSVTDGNLRKHLEQHVGQPAQFDVIFAIHVFHTIPPAQRRQALQTWKRMLAQGGRLILTMSARFTPSPLSSIQGPLQFSSAGGTEAPGSYVVIANSIHSNVQVADGSLQRARHIIAAVQVAPNRLWQVAQAQSVAAAQDVGLRVASTRNIGRGDTHNLPLTASSPPPAQLASLPALTAWMQARTVAGRQCWGRWCEALASFLKPGWNSRVGSQKDFLLVEALQEFVGGQIKNVDEQRARILAQSPQTQSANVAESSQVGVLVELQV
jgi:ubiquinone/menaquinone biosynthesis C-methylase UbiE